MLFGIALVETIAATRRATAGATFGRPRTTRAPRPRRLRHDGE
jgi:hypothetical protein